jgi:hypothetical protein
MIGGAALASPSKPFPSFRHIEDQRKVARREALSTTGRLCPLGVQQQVWFRWIHRPGRLMSKPSVRGFDLNASRVFSSRCNDRWCSPFTVGRAYRIAFDVFTSTAALGCPRAWSCGDRNQSPERPLCGVAPPLGQYQRPLVHTTRMSTADFNSSEGP